MELTECKRILERQKEAKIKYCQDKGLPIPAFDCADDYWIPVSSAPFKHYAEVMSNRYYYCPNCGAKMDVKEG